MASKKKTRKLKMWAVYSQWGFHAFYQTEETAKRHWKNSKKHEIFYQIYPVKLEVELSPRPLLK